MKITRKSPKLSMFVVLPLLFSFLIFSACGNEESETTLVSVGFAPSQNLDLSFETLQEFSQGLVEFLKNNNPYPSVIDEVIIEVTCPPPAELIRVVVSGEEMDDSFRALLEVPPGQECTFSVTANNPDGEVIFSGEEVETVEDRLLFRVDVELEFQCHRTAWDPKGDTILGLASGLLGETAEQLGLENVDQPDLLSLTLEVEGGDIVITADFLEEIDSNLATAVILLDIDQNPATPDLSNILSLTRMIPGIGIDYIIMISGGGSVHIIDTANFNGNWEAVFDSEPVIFLPPQISTQLSLPIPATILGGATGAMNFFAFYGIQGLPSDFVPNWGFCQSQ